MCLAGQTTQDILRIGRVHRLANNTPRKLDGGVGRQHQALRQAAQCVQSGLPAYGWSAGSDWRGNGEDDGTTIGSLQFKGSVRPRDDLELSLIERYTYNRSDFDAFVGGDRRPVLDSDDETSLAARVLRQEHRVYPQAVRWFAEGKLTLDNGRVRLAADLVSDSAFVSPVPR